MSSACLSTGCDNSHLSRRFPVPASKGHHCSFNFPRSEGYKVITYWYFNSSTSLMKIMWVLFLGLWEWILCELCSVDWSETFDSCIKDNPFFLLAFQIFPPNSSFVFAFVLPFIIKPSWSFHLISYVPFPFYGLWVFYFTRVKQEVSSGPRWFIWSPRFYSQVLIILFFTFISLFHLKFAFILCIVWGLHFIFLLMDRAMPA